MANFAKAELLKFGWKEGKGLGKNEDGIAEPLKPTLKLDTMGLGYNEFTDDTWWEREFKKAINAVRVISHDDNVSLSLINNESNNNTSKKGMKTEGYGDFVKTGIFHSDSSARKGSTSLGEKWSFKACGGRTAHKAARHSLKLSGKLERIAMQDRMLLAASISGASQSNASSTVGNTLFHKNTKSSTESDTEGDECEILNEIDTLQSTVESPVTKSRSSIKRQKKKIKHLIHQLSTCTIKEKKNKESECNSSDGKRHCRKKGNKNRKESAFTTLLKQNIKNQANNAFFEIIPLSGIPKVTQESTESKETQDHKDAREELSNAFNKAKADLNEMISSITKEKNEQNECPTIVINIETDEKDASKSNWSVESSNIDQSICTKDLPKLKNSDNAEARFFHRMNRFIKDKIDNEERHLLYSKCSVPQLNTTTMLIRKIKHNINKKKEQLCNARKRLAVLNEAVEKLTNQVNERRLDTIVKDLMAVNLTENVSATIKKKPTQTHLAPV